jgi:histone deacetylase complex subunit SAP30
MTSTTQPTRISGKRQVRPNLTRADFGYEQQQKKSATTNNNNNNNNQQQHNSKAHKTSAAHKSAKEHDDDETNNTKKSAEDKAAAALTVDFSKLDMVTLKRYKRHYRLKTRQNVTKPELAHAIAKHFATQTIDEADTISLFMYSARASADSIYHDRRDYISV